MVYYHKPDAWILPNPPDDITLQTLDITTRWPQKELKANDTFARVRGSPKGEFELFAQDVAKKLMGKVRSSLVPIASSLAPLMFALSSCRLVRTTSPTPRPWGTP